MLLAAATLTERIVVATMDAPFKPMIAPDNTEYLTLTVQLYADLKDDLFNKDRTLRWRLVDDGFGSFNRIENITNKLFYAICNTGDRAIVALDTAIPDFTRSGTEVVEISQADFIEINRVGQWHDVDGLISNRNCAADGTVTPRPDTRPVLRVTQPNPAITGTPVVINFSWEDSSGRPLPVNEGRDIFLRSNNAPPSRVRITLIGGKKSVQRSLEVGLHELMTSDPTSYRMAGDTIIEVAEAWT